MLVYRASPRLSKPFAAGMRVCCISPSYLPRVGGGEKYAHRLNAALAKRGATVHVLTSVANCLGGRLQDGVRIEYVKAGTFVGFPWFRVGDLRRVFREQRPHVVVAYGPSPYDPVVASACALLGHPYVQVYHADFNDKKLATRLATWLHNVTALRLASAIICTNQRMFHALGRRGFSNRTIVATPGVDDGFFSRSSPETIRGESLLFVGALDEGHRYKRLDILLKAVLELFLEGHTIHLTVVGDGNRRAYFEQLAREMGIGERVEFLGALTEDELVSRYARSGALVLPSPTTQEGFGLVCLEAMASGVPVVCSKNAGAAQIVHEAPAGALWNGQDIDDLKHAIIAVQQATAEKREALRAYVCGYGWDAMCARLLEDLGVIFPCVRSLT